MQGVNRSCIFRIIFKNGFDKPTNNMIVLLFKFKANAFKIKSTR